MKFCPYCGNQIQLDNVKFCPECGKVLALIEPTSGEIQPHNEANKIQLIKDVEMSCDFVEDVYSEYAKIKEYDSLPYENNVLDKIKGKLTFISLLISIVPPILLTTFMSISNNHIFDGSTIVCSFVLFPLIGIFFYFYASSYKRIGYSKEYRACQEYVAKMQEKVDDENSDIFDTIQILMESERGKKALSIIPQDYFYPKAVEMILFYLQNGQADSIKEALKEYDQYLHRCKLEYEAERTANAAERTAKSAERTADAAMATARNTASMRDSMYTIKQYEASTNFWTIYNALK